ncbi:MAG: hypothetical protein Q9M32_08345 [Sulfurimonas sp.]|nr:hypothetical protein [Sulfurimonas sp.]MDQ7061795.1 hypothetical protein [Sulfurimonas sp.]
MPNISKYKTLTQAKDSFSQANYKQALEKFAYVLENFPNSKEAYNGVILSEMAMSGEGGAEALFDYYEILREEDQDAADAIMDDILQNMDGTIEKLGEIFADPIRQRVELEDGILYQDFKSVVNSTGNFKSTFENIMFSTKVIITQKEDFLDFLDNLIEHGYSDMALTYLENALGAFPADEPLQKLLKKLVKVS